MARADEFVGWLARTTGAGVEDAVRIDRIAALERVKGALAAAQVRQTVAFAESQRAGLPAWTPERTVARSIGSQVALARRESPTRGDAHVELDHALSRSMPSTLAALTVGRISEAAAEGVHRALEGMDRTLRGQVDERLAPELGTLGERSLTEAARREAMAVDEGAATRRAEKAVASRRVTLRTAKDGMAYVTVLAPMAEAAGAFQAVEAEATALLGEPCRVGAASRRSAFWLADPAAVASDADSFLRSAGVRSTRSQLMADIVIARLTGRAIGEPVPIDIQLVMTDLARQGEAADQHDAPSPEAGSRRGPTADAGARPSDPASDSRPVEQFPARSAGPAKVIGAGWLPAGFASELVRRTAAAGSCVTVRRVVTGDDGTTVVGIEARRQRWSEAPQRRTGEPPPVLAPTSSLQRLFRGVLRRLVVVRDHSCRTPFCGAAIRAIDHVTPACRKGPTCLHNAAGTCVRCNLTKEAPGWTVVPLGSSPRVRPYPDDPPWQQLMDSLLADDEEPGQETHRGHRSMVVTPTGHRYLSRAPAVSQPDPDASCGLRE